MSDFKSYISNENLVSLDDLEELIRAYKAIVDISLTMKAPISHDVDYNIKALTREVDRRSKQ